MALGLHQIDPLWQVVSPKPVDDRERYYYIAGLDLGQTGDNSALVVLEKSVYGAGFCGPRDPRYYVRVLTLYPLNTDYVDIAEDVLSKRLDILTVDATGGGRPFVDMLRRMATSRGFKGRIKPIVVATSSMREAAMREKGFWSVPKRELVGAIVLMYQTQQLVLPGCPECNVRAAKQGAKFVVARGQRVLQAYERAEQAYDGVAQIKQACRCPTGILLGQMGQFKMTITKSANMRFEAKAPNHDDLVMAMGQCCWWAHKFRGNQPAIFVSP